MRLLLRLLLFKIVSSDPIADAVKWYFKENKKMFQAFLDEKTVFKSLFFQNIYDPSKDERRLKKMEREATLKKQVEEEREERQRTAKILAEGKIFKSRAHKLLYK